MALVLVDELNKTCAGCCLYVRHGMDKCTIEHMKACGSSNKIWDDVE